MADSASHQPPQPALSDTNNSERYNRLVSVLQKALSKSISQLDIDGLIQQVYASDASIFGDDQLRIVMESLLENVDDKVQKDMLDFLHSQNVKHKLLRVERILGNLQAQDLARQQAQQRDKERTLRALEHNKLPSGVRPMDLANYQRYQKLVQEKQKLQEDMAATKIVMDGLEQSKADRQEQVRVQSHHFQTIHQQIEQVATAGSSMTLSGEVVQMESD